MESNEGKRASARLGWALATPFLLAFGLIFLPIVPALCVFLDSRSRTYTGAVTLLAGSAALTWLLGMGVGSVLAFICLATAGAYALLRARVPFLYGLAGSAGGGVLGAVALLGILGATLGKPLNQAAAGIVCDALKSISTSWAAMYQGLPTPLDIIAALSSSGQSTGGLMFSVPQSIIGMSVADKINLVQPVFELNFSAYIPAWALAMGLLTGGLAYYLPALAQARLEGDREAEKPAAVAVPAFQTFKFPKYIVVSILLLQLVTYFANGNLAMLTVYIAANAVMTLMMTVQSLSMLSYFMTRKAFPTILQFVILVPVTLLFSWWLLEFVGLFDVLFDLRAMAARVEVVRAKGKQVFSQGGLDELRKMSDKTGKNNKDGKDGKDGEGKA